MAVRISEDFNEKPDTVWKVTNKNSFVSAEVFTSKPGVRRSAGI